MDRFQLRAVLDDMWSSGYRRGYEDGKHESERSHFSERMQSLNVTRALDELLPPAAPAPPTAPEAPRG